MTTPKGFLFAAAEGAVKRPGRLDMGLILCQGPATVAATFTKNLVAAAPVELSRRRAAKGTGRAVLVNAGNANACTGPQGLADAERLTAALATQLGLAEDDVLTCSTGVIGLPLPVDRMLAALPALEGALAPDIEPFARSIMTTDTFMKVAHREVSVGTGVVRLSGAAKGAGMIRPDMATMLGFVVTDARVDADAFRRMTLRAVEASFNRITIDGDTSTNDTFLALASGMADAPALADDPELAQRFAEALESLCRELARQIVRDGEGATKLVDVTVTGAASDADAFLAARAIAESPLVKTALHGEDPNWGRIAAALGRSGAYRGGPFHIFVGGVPLVREGQGLGADAERAAHEVMLGKEYEIMVMLAEGHGEATVVTCDFSADYVKINADYRS